MRVGCRCKRGLMMSIPDPKIQIRTRPENTSRVQIRVYNKIYIVSFFFGTVGLDLDPDAI